MTKKEFSMFAMALKTYYPRETLLPNEQAIELWFFQLQDLPYKVAEASLNKWVALNKWSPSIADIREVASGLMNGEQADWSEAWESVLHAIDYYGSYRPSEAMESLPPMTREAVKRIGFYNLCNSENISADRANFRQIYTTLAERERQRAQIPEPLKELIGQIQTKAIEQKEGA